MLTPPPNRARSYVRCLGGLGGGVPDMSVCCLVFARRSGCSREGASASLRRISVAVMSIVLFFRCAAVCILVFLLFAPCPGRVVWRARHAAGARGNNSNEANRNNYGGSERNAGDGRNSFRGKDSRSSGSSSSNEVTTNARNSVRAGNNRLQYKKKRRISGANPKNGNRLATTREPKNRDARTVFRGPVRQTRGPLCAYFCLFRGRESARTAGTATAA